MTFCFMDKESIEIIVDEISEQEKAVMKTMGLPSHFSSSKKYDKSKKKQQQHGKVKKSLCKYWHQRYRLFSRFDQGIKLDKESWYSVTPEMIALHIASRCVKDDNYRVIMDPFCGVGGNIIQFASFSKNVFIIASDIDPKKVSMAKHNATIYDVSHRIAFMVGDFFNIIKTIKIHVDCIFLSPPWGGPDYLKQDNYSLSSMTPDGFNIYNAAKKYITPNIAFLLPRNIDRDDLNSLLQPGEFIEIEQNLINDKPKTVTAYFGDLAKQDLLQS
uniref:Trimethylguanosine synthase n=2 Tax=Tetranychus urticae TaxID=32264 RepID=T1K5S1_TETUR